MEINREQVEVFMVALFLIKNHGYRFVTLQQHQDELWLGNPTNTEFPVIRVSSSLAESVYFDKNRLMQIHTAILKVLHREARLLDLHISGDTEVMTDPDFEQTILNQGTLYGKSITHCFPLIKTAITPFDDPKEEFARLNRDLEDYQASKKKQKRKMSKLGKIKATYVVMIICVLFYFLNQGIAAINGYSVTSISIALGAYFRNAIVMYGQFYRFITVGLHHLSIWHLLMNMSSLRVIGLQLEEIFGWKKFIAILLFSTLTGSMLMYAVDSAEFAVGLSGGLYGCMAAWFVYAYTRGLFKVPAFRNSLTQTLMMNLLINLMPNVAVSAHLGGFIGGLLASVVLLDYKPWKEMRKHAIIASLMVMLLLGWRTVSVKPPVKLYYEDFEMIEIYQNAGFEGYADNLAKQMAKYYK